MDPWYKVVGPRKEEREGRSFNPDEFAIALDQVVANKGPADYRKPEGRLLPVPRRLERRSRQPGVRS